MQILNDDFSQGFSKWSVGKHNTDKKKIPGLINSMLSLVINSQGHEICSG